MVVPPSYHWDPATWEPAQGHSLTDKKGVRGQVIEPWDDLTHWPSKVDANSPLKIDRRRPRVRVWLECFCSSLLNFKLGEVGPAWASNQHRNDARTHGISWCSVLHRIIGRVAIHLVPGFVHHSMVHAGPCRWNTWINSSSPAFNSLEALVLLQEEVPTLQTKSGDLLILNG